MASDFSPNDGQRFLTKRWPMNFQQTMASDFSPNDGQRFLTKRWPVKDMLQNSLSGSSPTTHKKLKNIKNMMHFEMPSHSYTDLISGLAPRWLHGKWPRILSLQPKPPLISGRKKVTELRPCPAIIVFH
ncbi:hypothetical protein E2P81_ATG07839 [Venturia nashicola]|nr:hypothetical protein E2P81_ATG07839 [Venturia nashicola]